MTYGLRGIRPALPALLAGALLASALVGWADDASFPSTQGQDGTASGAEIYSHICQGCHMPGGTGAEGAGHYPRLAGDPALAAWKYPALIVLGGRHGMPPFGLPADQVEELRAVHLSDGQIADVVNYIRTHFGNQYPDTVSAAQIAALPHPGLPAKP